MAERPPHASQEHVQEAKELAEETVTKAQRLEAEHQTEADVLAEAAARLVARLGELEKRVREYRTALLLAVAGLTMAGMLTTGAAFAVVRHANAQDTKAIAAQERLAGVRRARSNCEAVNEANQATLGLLNVLLDGGARRDEVLPLKARAEAAARREEARRAGAERLKPKDCAAKFPDP